MYKLTCSQTNGPGTKRRLGIKYGLLTGYKTIRFPCSTIHYNLVPRVSPLHAPGSERGETLVGAGHVSPREKLDPGRGPWLASLCQDLLSTPKRAFRFAARSPRETHSTGYVFSVVFILRVVVTLILKLNESVVLRRYTLGTM